MQGREERTEYYTAVSFAREEGGPVRHNPPRYTEGAHRGQKRTLKKGRRARSFYFVDDSALPLFQDFSSLFLFLGSGFFGGEALQL